MSGVVGNPNCWFSHAQAQKMFFVWCLTSQSTAMVMSGHCLHFKGLVPKIRMSYNIRMSYDILKVIQLKLRLICMDGLT